jgi:hypothetical protein
MCFTWYRRIWYVDSVLQQSLYLDSITIQKREKIMADGKKNGAAGAIAGFFGAIGGFFAGFGSTVARGDFFVKLSCCGWEPDMRGAGSI